MEVKGREGGRVAPMQRSVAYGSPAVPVMSVPFALGIYARRCQAEGSMAQEHEQDSDSGVWFCWQHSRSLLLLLRMFSIT